jgi:hypothetical protein
VSAVARCKHAFARLARARWDDPDARRLAQAIVEHHGDTVLHAWTVTLPRFTAARTPSAAWAFHVELDRAWTAWLEGVQRELGLHVAATPFLKSVELTVGVHHRDHYFRLASTAIAERASTPAAAFFDRAWARLALPIDDILAANLILDQPHDIELELEPELPWFARARPPRSAPRAELISWLLHRQLLREASAAQLAELDDLAVAALTRIGPTLVASPPPTATTDETVWARWLIDVDRALADLNRRLRPAASVFVRLEQARRRLQVFPGVELRGRDADDVGVVETTGTLVALDDLLARLGAPRAHLLRAASMLVQPLATQLGTKLDHIRYYNLD